MPWALFVVGNAFWESARIGLSILMRLETTKEGLRRIIGVPHSQCCRAVSTSADKVCLDGGGGSGRGTGM